MALTVGSRLGHYNGIPLIDEGGMGQVYRARDTKLDRVRKHVGRFVITSACAAICLGIGLVAPKAFEAGATPVPCADPTHQALRPPPFVPDSEPPDGPYGRLVPHNTGLPCTSSNQRRPMSLVGKRDSWLVDRSVRRV